MCLFFVVIFIQPNSQYICIYRDLPLVLFQQQRRRVERKQLLSWNPTVTTLSLRIVLLREILLVHWLGMLQALPTKSLPHDVHSQSEFLDEN
jgi:hypothetical protein